MENKRITVDGMFNGFEVQVLLVEHNELPGEYDLDIYPDLMMWSDAADVLADNGYHENDRGLWEKNVTLSPL